MSILWPDLKDQAAKQSAAKLSHALPSSPSAVQLVGDVPFDEAVARFKKRYLTELVEACGFNVTKAARFARVDARNFRRLLQRFGVPTRAEVAPFADLTDLESKAVDRLRERAPRMEHVKRADDDRRK